MKKKVIFLIIIIIIILLIFKIIPYLILKNIEKSETSVEKIWFIVQVEKIVAKEIKEND